MEDAMRDTQVTTELREMKEVLVEIEGVISALDTRLNVVLTNESEEKAASENTVEVSLVPLADDLRCKNRLLRGFLAKINGLRRRVEL